MREKLGFLLCVWIFLWGNCLATFVKEKNSLRVTSPESIKGVYECAIGNFGVPQYGGTLVGRIIYITANQRACRDFHAFYTELRRGALPTVLLVDRGDCYFSLKAWYAQKAGAAAVLVADNRDEPLITMDNPEDDQYASAEYLHNITIPAALISKSLGDSIKVALRSREVVTMTLQWGDQSLQQPDERVQHPDERVKYEFWTSSSNMCGSKCHSQMEFVNNFKGAAQMLEQKGYTRFTPHYITWYCPEAFILSKQCKSQCINHGRYCAPDPDQDFSRGYEGKDVVVQNLRQACFFKVANEIGKPWLWWDYVTDFAKRCPMKEKKYNKECADQVIRSLGVDLVKIDKCIGDPGNDVANPVLDAEQDARGNGYRGVHVTTLPTLVINNRQYRGELSKEAVLKAICADFHGTKKPAICFDKETYEPLQNNDGAGWTRELKFTPSMDGRVQKNYGVMMLLKYNTMLAG